MYDGLTDMPVGDSSRQKKITDIVQAILPHLPRRSGHSSLHKTALIGGMILCAALSGYMLCNNYRPISYSEKMTLQVLIEYSAQQKKTTIQAVTRDLIQHLTVDKVRNIRAYQWAKAIDLLNNYLD